MRSRGFEPPRAYAQQPLKLPCMPIHHDRELLMVGALGLEPRKATTAARATIWCIRRYAILPKLNADGETRTPTSICPPGPEPGVYTIPPHQR